MRVKQPVVVVSKICSRCICLVVALVAGCGTDRNATPLTENEIVEMSLAKPNVAALEIVTSANPILNETIVVDDQNDSSSILNALLPIKSAKPESLEPSKIDYVFHFQAGKNPANFSIAIDEDRGQLKFQVDQFTYDGGQMRRFQDAVAVLRKKHEAKAVNDRSR